MTGQRVHLAVTKSRGTACGAKNQYDWAYYKSQFISFEDSIWKRCKECEDTISPLEWLQHVEL